MAELDFEDDPLDQNEGFSPPPQQGFFARNRTLIVSSVIGTVLFGGVYFFIFRDKPAKSPSGNALSSGMNQNSSDKIEPVQGRDSRASEPKKNKKVKYKLLYELTVNEAAKAHKELSMADIDFSTEQKGKKYELSVDETRLDDAKRLLAIKGLPGGASNGYELLDNAQTLGVTEFDKRVRFVRALSGELEKAVLQFDIIENCKVQIVLPEQKLFAVTQPPVTAAVLIKRYPGTGITDDIVYSIIQLVANAVENLQPENVSVIDTEGVVLSNGIFERMAARDARKAQVNLPSANALKIEEEAPVGTPVVPNFEEIKKWQEVKFKFERSLEDKAYDQLIGILPEGSFKIAISADLGPLENGEIVDIKRLTTSIVVDNSRQDLVLDPLLKKQIFNTIASAIGYVRGRDTIQLNRADFRFLSEADKKSIASRYRWRNMMRMALKYSPYAGGAVAGLGVGYGVYRWIRNRRGSLPSSTVLDDENRDTDFESLQTELNIDRYVDRIKEVGAQNPQMVARMIESWIQEG
jgi:flagellar biosynthesis/type III secretory pathway M-ring protein FliF/YscJ